MHLEALDEKRREIFSRLNAFDGFYLAGGTALALQIGHRISLDFDLFSGTPIPATLLQRVEKTFAGKTIQPSVSTSDELSVFVDGVKMTFLVYPFPVLFDFAVVDGVSLLSVKEIAATKAYTIGRRGSWRDYVDMYFVLAERHAALVEIIEIAERKYKDQFNGRLFLEQLVYWEDIEDTKIVFLKKSAAKEEIQKLFEEEVRKF